MQNYHQIAAAHDGPLGAIDISDWTLERSRALGPAKLFREVADYVVARDVFAALYGLDPMATIPGPFGARSRSLLTQAFQLPEWSDLCEQVEANPWACATAARFILEAIRETPEEKREQAAADKLRQAIQQAAQAAGQGQGEQGQDNGQGGQQEGEGDGQGSAPSKAQQKANAAAQKAAEDYQEAKAEADQAAQAKQEQIARACKGARKEAEEVEDAVRGLSAGSRPGTERALGAPIHELAQLVQGDRRFRKVARIAGAMAESGALSARKRRRARGSEETVDLTTGGISDIAEALPLDLLGLVDADLAPLLERALIDDSLSVEFRTGTTQERGPIVCCVDESGSMEGPRIEWAKAVALALFFRARIERRPFAVIRFDVGTRTVVHRRPQSADLAEVRAWADGFLSGGTCIDTAYTEALRVIAEIPGYSKADVVVISDGESDNKWLKQAQTAKSRGIETHGIAIGLRWSAEQKKAISTCVEIDDNELGNLKGSARRIDAALAV